MPTYINKIGVELELGVKYTENGSIPSVSGFTYTNDGSINSRGIDADTAKEYVSEPLNYNSQWNSNDMEMLEKGIFQLYKKHGATCNESMGMHIHVSFNKDYYYYALASEKFIEYFEEKIVNSRLYENNARLRSRFKGNNRYCKKVNVNDIQQTMKGGRKYRHFTYRSGRKTVEFRLLPAFDRKIDVKKGIDLITSIVNGFLYNKHHEFEEEVKVNKNKEEDLIPDKNDISEKDITDVIEYV